MSRLTKSGFIGTFLFASMGVCAIGSNVSAASHPQENQSQTGQRIVKVEEKLITKDRGLGQLLKAKKKTQKTTLPSTETHSSSSSLFSQQIVGHTAPPALARQSKTNQNASIGNPVFNRTQALNRILGSASIRTNPIGRGAASPAGSSQQYVHQNTNGNPLRSQFALPPRSVSVVKPNITTQQPRSQAGSISLIGPGSSPAKTTQQPIQTVAYQQPIPAQTQTRHAIGNNQKSQSLSGTTIGNDMLAGSGTMKVSGRPEASSFSAATPGRKLRLSDPRFRKPLGQVIESPNLDSDMLELEEFSTKRPDNMEVHASLSKDQMKELEKSYQQKNQHFGPAIPKPLTKKQNAIASQEQSVPNAVQKKPIPQSTFTTSSTGSASGTNSQVIQVSGQYGPSFLDMIFDFDQLGTSKQQLAKRLGNPDRHTPSTNSSKLSYQEIDGFIPTAFYRNDRLEKIEFRLQKPANWSSVRTEYGLSDFQSSKSRDGSILLSEINLKAIPLDANSPVQRIDNIVIDKIVFVPGLRETMALQAATGESKTNGVSLANSNEPKPTNAVPADRSKTKIRASSEKLIAMDTVQMRARIESLATRYGNSGQTILEEVHYHNVRRSFFSAQQSLDRLDPNFLDSTDMVCYYFEQATCSLAQGKLEDAIAAAENLKSLQTSEDVKDIRDATFNFLSARILIEKDGVKAVRDRNLKTAVQAFSKSLKLLQSTKKIEHPSLRRLASTMFVMNHAYLGQAIAEGPFDNKEKASTLWYQHANKLAFKMKQKQSASSLLQFAAQKVAVDAAIRSGNPKAIQLALNHLHSQFAEIRFKLEPIDRDMLTQWLGEDYYQAAFHNYRSDDLNQAIRFHRQSERFMGLVSKVHSAEEKAWLEYCKSRNHWLKGAIEEKSGKSKRAMDWFEKSLESTPSLLTQRIAADQAEQGERMANMAVTYWILNRRKKAVELTGKGLAMIQECVSLGQCSAARLKVPESNLIQMQTEIASEVDSRQKSQIADNTPTPASSNQPNPAGKKVKATPVSSKPKKAEPVKKGSVPIIQASDVPSSAWRPKN